jgi:hypothetical protein
MKDKATEEDLLTVRAMLRLLTPTGIAEIEHALRLQLAPRFPTPARQRRSELGYLAELMDRSQRAGHHHIERSTYDRDRPGDAPSSAALVRKFGSWRRACRAASSGLKVTGKKGGGAPLPWIGGPPGSSRPPPYTREEVAAAIRACARDLGRRPTAYEYDRWVRTKRARARAAGTILRLPRLPEIHRVFPTGKWRRALGEAAVTETELHEVRSARIPGAQDAEEGTLVPDRTELPLSQAARLAADLGCSLDWLAGRTAVRGQPSDPNTRLDPGVLLRRRREAQVPEAKLRAAAGLNLSRYRRIVRGSAEPTLGELAVIAGVLDIQIHSLCREPDLEQ